MAVPPDWTISFPLTPTVIPFAVPATNTVPPLTSSVPELVTIPLSDSVPLRSSTMTPRIVSPFIVVLPPASFRIPEPSMVASVKLAELLSVRLFDGVSVRVAPDCSLKMPE